MNVPFRAQPKRLFLVCFFGIIAASAFVVLIVQLGKTSGSSEVIVYFGAFFAAGFFAWYHAQQLRKYKIFLKAYLSDRKWTLVAEPFDARNDPAHLYPHGGLVERYETLQPDFVAELTNGTHRQTSMIRTVRYSMGKSHGSFQLVVMQTSLNGTVSGWLRLHPKKSRFIAWTNGIKLESGELNELVRLQAEPEKLAYEVFAPDVMQWYLEQSLKPWIHVEGNTLSLVLEGWPQSPALDTLFSQLQQMTHFVETSGALDKG